MKHHPPLIIQDRPIDALVLDPRNPRRHSRRQVKQIAHSIESFGFIVPVVVDGHNKVLAGHGRVLAARRLGWRELPTVCLEHLSETQSRAFMIADNRLTETSDWDDRLLAETLIELSGADLTFDIEATGFSTGEIDLRIEGLSDSANDDVDPADAMPDPDTQVPISKLGGLWLLDRHRVICADALEARSYSRLFQGERAAMGFTDPPYNVRISGHASGLGRIQHREFAMAAGEMSETEFIGFLMTSTAHMVQYSVNGAIHYICMDWRHAREMLAAGEASFTELKNICVWAKPNAGMGSFYRSQHEFVFVFKSGRGSHRNNVELGRHGRHRSNVWNYPGANSFGRATDEGHLLALHPTVKPVRLVADAILDCSARGDIVLDPFLGSGSTLIAAERTGRRCYGIEIDPLYVDTIIRRWQAYTGEVALRSGDNRSFDELAMEVTRGS
jgi:DNA modification methylase